MWFDPYLSTSKRECTWWRNLRGGEEVKLLIGRQDFRATAKLPIMRMMSPGDYWKSWRRRASLNILTGVLI